MKIRWYIIIIAQHPYNASVLRGDKIRNVESWLLIVYYFVFKYTTERLMCFKTSWYVNELFSCVVYFVIMAVSTTTTDISFFKVRVELMGGPSFGLRGSKNTHIGFYHKFLDNPILFYFYFLGIIPRIRSSLKTCQLKYI